MRINIVFTKKGSFSVKSYILAAALAGTLAAAPAAAQSFSYADFSNTANLQINGNAAVRADALNRQVLRLTPAAAWQSGSVFSTTQIALAANASFSTAFTFNINSSDAAGADGLVFVVQPVSSTTGGAGGEIGYGGIANSLGVEFDTYFNGAGYGDPNGNHVGVNLNGNISSVQAIASPFALDGGTDLTAFIDYNGSTQTLEIRLSDNGMRPGAALISYGGLNLASVLGTTNAFVGFTSGTGASYSNHDIINWQFNNSFQPIDPGNNGAVPEPATWAMMLLGFGAMGAGLRRRPKVAAKVSFA